eukprot:12219036-Alexandrium_andersonii.AAC.1
MQIRAPVTPREAQGPPLDSGAPNFCRFRAAERAVWPFGRAGTASSRVGFWRDWANRDQRAKWRYRCGSL